MRNKEDGEDKSIVPPTNGNARDYDRDKDRDRDRDVDRGGRDRDRGDRDRDRPPMGKYPLCNLRPLFRHSFVFVLNTDVSSFSVAFFSQGRARPRPGGDHWEPDRRGEVFGPSYCRANFRLQLHV